MLITLRCTCCHPGVAKRMPHSQHHVVCVNAPSTAWWVLWRCLQHENTMICWRSTQEPDERMVTQLFTVFLCWCVNRFIVLSCWGQHNITDILTDWTRDENVKVKQAFRPLVYRIFLSIFVLDQWTFLANAFSEVHVSQNQGFHLWQAKTNNPKPIKQATRRTPTPMCSTTSAGLKHCNFRKVEVPNGVRHIEVQMQSEKRRSPARAGRLCSA